MHRASSLDMTIQRESTPDLSLTTSLHIWMLYELTQKQWKVERDIENLDQRLQTLESEVVMLVIVYECNVIF